MAKNTNDSRKLKDFPKLLKQALDARDKNNELNTNLARGSNKKLWWKCDADDDHLWLTPIKVRTAGFGCPFCSHKRASRGYNFKSRYPEVAKQWHPTKNGTGKEMCQKNSKEDQHTLWPRSLVQKQIGNYLYEKYTTIQSFHGRNRWPGNKQSFI